MFCKRPNCSEPNSHRTFSRIIYHRIKLKSHWFSILPS